MFRDAVRSTETHLVRASGLRWVSLMWLTHIPFANRTWALPVLTALAPPERYHRRIGRPHKKITDWARQMIFQLHRWLPERTIVVVSDGGYAALELLPSNNLLSFTSTQTSRSFTFDPIEDDNDCDDETVIIGYSISSSLPVSAGPSASRTRTINLDDNEDASDCVVTPTKPTANFSSPTFPSPYPLTEGGNVTVRVRLSSAVGQVFYIPITFSGDSDAYSFTGLDTSTFPDLNRLRFESNDTDSTFTFTAAQDTDCLNETVEMSLNIDSTSPVTTGTPSSVTIRITDNDCQTPPPPPTLGPPTEVKYTLTATSGSVMLSWTRASNAASYQVWRCVRIPTDPNRCNFARILALDTTGTTATVTGLETAYNEHKLRIRSIEHGQSRDSAVVTVKLKPAPENLTGVYKTGQYGQITLTWKPVPNPDVDRMKYHVEQLFGSDWERLPHDGVTIGSIESGDDSLTVVVSGLKPGDFQHRVRAESVQGLSEPSNATTTTVLNEEPAMPSTPPTVDEMIAGRGIEKSACRRQLMGQRSTCSGRTRPLPASNTIPITLKAECQGTATG